MRKRVELLKSFVLFVLVALSLFLSFSIWSFRLDYDTIEHMKYIQKVSVGEKKEIGEVIIPEGIFLHTGSSHYQLGQEGKKELLKNYLGSWEVFDVKLNNEGYNQEAFYRQSSKNPLLQIEFPTEVSSLFLSGLFMKAQIDKLEFSFHYILLSLENGKENAIYFINDSTGQVYEGLLKQSNMAALKEYLLADELVKTSVLPFMLGENQLMYLPSEPFYMVKTTFLTDGLESEQFKTALFSNPKYVKRSGEDGNIFYTDGTRLLRENSQNFSLVYINPINVEIKNQESQRFQLESFNYVNNHAGFTGNYYLSDVLEDNRQVVFRMYYKNTPVFGKNLCSTIQVRWGEDESLSYIHPLYKLSFQVEKETTSVLIDSGAVIYEKISNNPDLDINLVQNLRIAYVIEYEGSYDQLVYLSPTWVVLYDGKWIGFHDLIEGDGGDLVGLE